MAEHEGMGEGIQHTLTKKVGPLPVWAWGAGIGAVLVIFLWINNRDNVDTGTPATAYDDSLTMDGQDQSLEDSNAYGEAYQSGYSQGSSQYASGLSDGTETVTDATGSNADGTASLGRSGPKTNKGWLRTAIAAAGFKNPLRASRVLNKYLDGERLNKDQRQIVKQAIATTGLPPDVPKHVSNTSKPQQTHQSANADHHVNPHTSNQQPGKPKPNPGKPKPPQHKPRPVGAGHGR